MSNTEFKWWWEDPKEMALWEKMQEKVSLVDNRLVIDVKDSIRQKLTEKYGNIYWYRPSTKIVSMHQSDALERYVHGNNSSGKSYASAAEFCYEVIGWSPYRDIKPAKYGHKLLWAFSPTYDVQRSSSQVHLFSTNSVNDIGLLPSLDSIKDRGGNVQWGANRTLNFVEFPNGVRIEFKSEEASTLHMQASGVDVAWFDEKPKTQTMKDEVVMRLIRKDGRMLMSFILDSDEMKSHWIVKDLYEPINKDEFEIDEVYQLLGIKADQIYGFFFLGIDDNDYLNDIEKALAKTRAAGKGKAWRFSKNGEFEAITGGDLVFPDASEAHLKAGLLETYDPHRVLFRFWDSGYNRPTVVGVQLDQWNRRKYMFAKMGKRQHIINFLDEVQAYTTELMPRVLVTKEMLPHDTNRHHPTGVRKANGDVKTEKEIFEDDYKLDVEVLYMRKAAILQNANNNLRKLADKETVIQVDPDHAELLKDCLFSYLMDEDKGEPKRDKYYEDVADCFMKAEAWFANQVDLDDIDFVDPHYHNINVGQTKVNYI